MNFDKMTKAQLITSLESLQTIYESDQAEDELQHLLHELQVHQIELEMQNRELRETQQMLEESRNSYADLYDFAPLGYVTLDNNGFIRAINLTGAALLGVERSRLIGTRFSRYINKSDLKQFMAHLRQCGCRKDRAITELRLMVRGAGSVPAQLVSLGVWDDDKQATFYRTAITDITDRRRAEEALRASEERFRALYDNNPSMFFTLDRNGTVLSVNHFGAERLGYRVDELVGMPVSVLHRKDDRTAVPQHLVECLEKPDTVHRWEICKVRKDGSTLWAGETARVVKGADGESAVLIVCEDISEAHDLSERLSYQASHDPLTGLVNRREFERRLRRVLEAARAEKMEHALCYLDLDQFKIVNDTCSHLAGDELLRQLGRLLQKQIRKRDTLARLGGDEFAVLMEHCSLQQARRAANAIRRATKSFRFVWEGTSFTLGISIGLVPITADSRSVAQVLKEADAACYVAKDAGRGRIHVHRPDDVELAQRYGEVRWATRINRALDQDRFHLFYQPIASIRRGGERGAHYELLIEMESEEGRLVSPKSFLPAAERYNLSTKVDRWVISKAFGWLDRHLEHLEHLYLCSINLSGHSLGDEEFLDFLIALFDERLAYPEKICFEITETATIANLGMASQFIQALKKMGCRFALDDFGSGLSSFAYLKNLPVDFLKIDGTFVLDICNDPVDLAVVKSMNELGHAMGKKTIAEFVETQAILEKLREVGVDYAQGYYIGKPQPIGEMM